MLSERDLHKEDHFQPRLDEWGAISSTKPRSGEKGNRDKKVEGRDYKDLGVVGNTTHTYMVTAITASAINQLVRTSGQQFRNYTPR
jgi:hypothetical protein